MSRDETPDATGLREVLAADEVSELVGDDIRYWLGNPFMDPSLMVQKVCHWVTMALAAHPTPDASPDPAVVAPDAGDNIVQRIVNAWDCCGTCAGGVLANHVAAAREADRAEVERLRALADMYLEEHDKQHARAEAAEERLADLVAKIEALADDGRRTTYSPHTVYVDDLLRALIPADAATALDTVREEAWDEGLSTGMRLVEQGFASPNPYRIARHTPGDGA